MKRAEALLATLTGVISARVVARPGGGVDEIHVLTTEDVTPKQTVRNVESALQARFNISVDHRKISVAQTTGRTVATARAPEPEPEPEPVLTGPRVVPSQREAATSGPPTPSIVPVVDPSEKRLLFVGHSIESLRSRRVRMRVGIDWEGERYVGESRAPDVPRARLEGFANATLRAIERVLAGGAEDEALDAMALDLDGVKVLDAFDRTFVLVSVSALFDRQVTFLTGAGPVTDSLDRAVILATLQATDRRVRAFLEGVERLPRARQGSTGGLGVGDPFEVWG